MNENEHATKKALRGQDILKRQCGYKVFSGHGYCYLVISTSQSELLGQFRLIGDRASDVSGGRIIMSNPKRLR